MGSKALKANVLTLIANLKNDSKKLDGGKTLVYFEKHISEGRNVETVRKALIEGTTLDSVMTDIITKQLVKYYNQNKLGVTGKLGGHVAATYSVPFDVEQGILTILQSAQRTEDMFKKPNPFDKATAEAANAKAKRLNALRKIGLDNENDAKFSKVNAHVPWFSEKRDRKIQAIFKDNLERAEDPFYERGKLEVSEKFYNLDLKHVKPRT